MKILWVLLIVALVAPVFAQEAPAGDSKADTKASSSAKETRWQGHIVRINKDSSTIAVRGGMKNMESTERQIAYDDSTKWTKQGKAADQSEFKEGSFVIVLGHADDKGVMHASRIDLRNPR